jgi:hypothetical protein
MTIGPTQYLGYAAGEVANNLTFSMVSAFLLVYHTDVAGISAATAGTLFLVVRVWGGVTDLSAGHRVDQSSTRWAGSGPTFCRSGPAAAAAAARGDLLHPERAERGGQGRLGPRLLRAVPTGLQLRQHPQWLPVGGDDAGARRAGQVLHRQGRRRQPHDPLDHGRRLAPGLQLRGPAATSTADRSPA